MTPKTEFKIDPKTEEKNLPHLIELGGKGILTPEVARKIKGKKGENLFKEITKIYDKKELDLKRVKQFVQENWRKIETNYIKEMENLTGHKFRQNKIVYISPLIWGIADVIGRKNVFIGIRFDFRILNYIVMHEITHLYYTDLIIKMKTYQAGKSPLMEGIDHLLLFKSPIKKLINSYIKY